ncbi:stage II sporulation protein D [Clostridium aestuarii]|uniref:Stage II sporulation protein D n=1 Tax=Clostridium aestuarii TaxID=338193 RepID=A0ABT4D6K2_9CLOT|nr:stage II sporulation protein D [Clostridium aestuarii]MCY6485633.1 stage II sporulation protein D [Clostridium aestuarii]
MKKVLFTIFMFFGFIVGISIMIVGIDNKKDIKNKKENEGMDSKVSIISKKYSSDELYIDVYLSKDKKIKKINIEDYVKGVVAAEMPVNFDIEALKAQAVAARTYGLSHIEMFGGKKSGKAYGGDVTDTIDCQAYISKIDRMNMWPKKYKNEYWTKLSKAVDETRNEVLTYKGELVLEPYYFSTSSGKTEDAVDVFSKEVPYLKSVDSYGEEISPKYKTEFKYTYDEFTSIINKSYSKANIKSQLIKEQLAILDRSKGKSVKKIKIGNVEITGREFREVLDLTSSNFTIEFNGNNIIVKCYGYGHGVGMSQWGAQAMAKEGKKYKEILKHYYNGVELFKLRIKN